MYYRVAIQMEAQPTWKWLSTALSSLNSLVPWLQYYRAIPPERMTLSKMRACIRAGAYQDDLTSQEERRLLFRRWLVRQGWLGEWQVAEEVRQEAPGDTCLPLNRGAGRFRKDPGE